MKKYIRVSKSQYGLLPAAGWKQTHEYSLLWQLAQSHPYSLPFLSHKLYYL